MSVSQTGCILHRKAGTFPPNELIEKILAENPTGWGAATVSEVDGYKFLEINSEAKTTTLAEIQETLESFPDQDITFYFCSSEVAISDKDMSPYILITKPAEDDPEQEEPQLVAFVRGNFPAYVQTGSSHPAEYHLVTDILEPKFKGLYEMVDGNLDKLMEQLKKPHFKKELLLTSVSEGTITLVAANGECLSFAQGNQSAEGPWGWVSNSYGFGAEKAPDKVVPPKKPGLFSRSTVREKAAQPDPEKKEEVSSKSPAEAATALGYTVKKWKPQASYSRKEKKNAYKMRIGYAPRGWEKDIEVDVYYNPQGKIMSYADVKALGPLALGVIQLAKNPEKESDTSPEHIEARDAKPAETKKVTAEVLPILGPVARERVNDVRNKDGYKKLISDNFDTISDPKQFETFETKFSTFAQQMGAKSMHEFAYWDFEMIYNLAKTDPLAIAVMANTFKNEFLKAHPQKVEVEVNTTDTGTGKKQGLFKRGQAA